MHSSWFGKYMFKCYQASSKPSLIILVGIPLFPVAFTNFEITRWETTRNAGLFSYSE